MGKLGQLLDRAIYEVAPRLGSRRLAARARWQFAQKVNDRLEQRFSHWEAADNDRTRAGRFMSSRLSPDSALEQEQDTIRDRARELYRSDPIAASFIDGRVNNIIGRGIRAQARIKADEAEQISEEQARKLNRALNNDFRRWAKRAGKFGESLYSLQRLAQRTWDLDGEVFVHFTAVRDPMRPIPLALEVIDPERVETPPQEAGNPNIRLGIERDDDGNIVAYWVRNSQPHDTKSNDYSYTRVDAFSKNGLPEMVHCFEKLFPGQSRGIPVLTPVIGKLKDRHDYDETVMISEQAAACYTAFVKGDSDPEDLAAATASETTSTGERLEDMVPGTIQYLGKDQDITFGNPNRPSGTFAAYMEYHNRCIAAGTGYPYELLMKDWTGLSYAAGRLSLIDGRVSFSCRQALLDEQLLCATWHHFTLNSVLHGAASELVDPVAYRAAPSIYTEHAWIPPGQPWIDPNKEVQSAALTVESNLGTLSAELASRGLDLEETLDTRQLEVQMLVDRGLPANMPQMNRDFAEEAGDEESNGAPAKTKTSAAGETAQKSPRANKQRAGRTK